MNFAAIERSAPKLEPCCCNRRLRLFILLCFLPIFLKVLSLLWYIFLILLFSRLDSERLLNNTLKTASLSNLMPESFKYPIRWARASGLLDFKVLIRAYFAKCFLLYKKHKNLFVWSIAVNAARPSKKNI